MKAVAWGPTQPQADHVIAAAEACDALVVQMVNAADGRRSAPHMAVSRPPRTIWC